MIITCLYCGNNAELVNGGEIYKHRSDLNHLKFWLCRPCDAYVGCHKNTDGTPFGTLAKPQLRKLRNRAHAIFDPIWRGKPRKMKRTKAYQWLAEELKISTEKCHIAMFNKEMCRKAVKIIENYWESENAN